MSDEPEMEVPVAAEYALGLLSGEELRAARERAKADPAFAVEVARWQGRLASLHEETGGVAPPAELWERISARTQMPPLNEGRDGNVVALRRSVQTWRAATVGMTALAASLAVVLIYPRASPPAAPLTQQSASAPMVAMLGDKGAMKVVASWDPAERQLVLAVAGPLAAQPKHSHELWIIPPGGKPRSLGTMPAGKQMHMRLANALAALLEQGATIAISVEPQGGSPTGAPTGPVVASGPLVPA